MAQRAKSQPAMLTPPPSDDSPLPTSESQLAPWTNLEEREWRVTLSAVHDDSNGEDHDAYNVSDS